MKLLNFAVINLTLCLIIGIGIADYTSISFQTSGIIASILAVCLIISYFICRNKVSNTNHFKIISYILTISLGVFIYTIHDEVNGPYHYTRQNLNNHDNIILEVVERLKPSAYHFKYVVEIRKVADKKTTGKLLLNIDKQFSKKELTVGELILTKAALEPLPKSLNPYQFNYGMYLKRQQIHNQINLNFKEYVLIDQHTISFNSLSAKLRYKINKGLKAYTLNPDQIAIINALLLGQRQDMDARIYNDYINAGAVHILAVSGLHVAIIWLILTYLFKPFHYIKHGKIIGIISTVLLLWGFAVVAGLSASVTRAVTMFTVITLAKLLNRPTNIYNTLATSAIVLLLFNPNFLFEVGFQMSYLAVLGIVSFRPILISYYYPKNKILKFFYNILVVSLAAQLGVLPISLFYFHQFPMLFLVSNLFILPFLSVILGFGIIVIVMALIHIPNNVFVEFYGWIINQMNLFINWVSSQESYLLTGISFDISMLITAYLCIIGLLLVLTKPKISRFVYLIGFLIMLQSTWLFQKQKHNENELIVFHKTAQTLIAEKNQDRLFLFSTMDSSNLKSDQIVKNYKVGKFIKEHTSKPIKPLYQLNDKQLFRIDSLDIWNIKSVQPSIILLSYSPKINLSRMIDSTHVKWIIADGSNYASDIVRWKNTCNLKNIKFHSTREKGYIDLSALK